MSARKDAILDAVDNVLTAYQEWQADRSDFRINPDSALADYLEVLQGVLDSGHTPQDCLALVLSAGKMLVQYRRYEDGAWKPHSLEPTEAFYLSVRETQESRREAAPPQTSMIEPVALLREQGVDDRQIARIYGTRDPDTGIWSGPFLRNGVPNTVLISQEADDPGTIIGEDWVHPRQTAERERFDADMKNRLHRIDNRAAEAAAQKNRRTVRPSEEEVAEYLAEGAFPNQAYRRWRDSGITLDEIMIIANRHDIVPSSKEDPTAPTDRLSPEDAELMSPPDRGEESNVAEFSKESFASAVLELHDAGKTPADIRQAVQQQFGQQFSPQKIAAVVRDASAASA